MTIDISDIAYAKQRILADDKDLVFRYDFLNRG
jgi:hypothetical protein